MLLGLMATCGTAAWAQTDVTSQYLQNADFSWSTAIDNHLCGYGKDMADQSTTYYGLQDVTGWEKAVLAGDDSKADYPNSGLGGAVFQYGSQWQMKGNNKTAPEAGPDNAVGNALGFFAVWGCGAYYYQDVTFPAGRYTLTFPIYNQSGTQANESQTGFFPKEGTAYTVAINPTVGAWARQTVSFTLEAETAGQIRLGYKSTGSGSAANPMIFIDGVKISYIDLNAAHKAAWQEALDAAKAAVANADYANVTGEELTALQAEIAKAEPTNADGYDAAAAALEQATATFTAAKADYDAYAAAQALNVDLPYALASLKPAAEAATNAADAKAKATALYLALRAYYESNAKAETVDGAMDMTASITNHDATDGNNGWEWTGNKNNPRNTESWTDANGKNDYMYFDGGNWSGTGWTTTMSQKLTVPAGKYLLTAKGRASEGVTLTMAVGEASVELPHVGAAGNVFDRGWNDGSVEFSNPDGEEVEILVKATTAGVHEWFSVGDFRLVQLEAIAIDMASEAEIQALNSAITAAEVKTLGFDKGEFAPYNNVAAIEALAAAKKLAATSELQTKKAVTTATAELTAAQWTANDADVDIVFNGMFATVTPDANYPLGWVRTNAWGQMRENIEGDFATAYYNQPGSLQYGNQGAYLMPLKADQWYKLTVYYRSHENNSNNKLTLSVLNAAEEGLAATDFEGNGSTTEWAKAEVCFKPAKADNYVLTLGNSGNTWITSVMIEKTTEDDPVGISTVAAEQTAQQGIFTLAGQRVEKAVKGLYIINGKKVVVK